MKVCSENVLVTCFQQVFPAFSSRGVRRTKKKSLGLLRTDSATCTGGVHSTAACSSWIVVVAPLCTLPRQPKARAPFATILAQVGCRRRQEKNLTSGMSQETATGVLGGALCLSQCNVLSLRYHPPPQLPRLRLSHSVQRGPLSSP